MVVVGGLSCLSEGLQESPWEQALEAAVMGLWGPSSGVFWPASCGQASLCPLQRPLPGVGCRKGLSYLCAGSARSVAGDRRTSPLAEPFAFCCPESLAQLHRGHRALDHPAELLLWGPGLALVSGRSTEPSRKWELVPPSEMWWGCATLH